MSSSPDLTASRRSSRYLLVVTSRTISSASLLPMPNRIFSARALILELLGELARLGARVTKLLEERVRLRRSSPQRRHRQVTGFRRPGRRSPAAIFLL